MHNATRGKIVRLRRYGFRLWAIAKDVNQPMHKVAAVLIERGIAQPLQFEQKYETRMKEAGLGK